MTFGPVYLALSAIDLARGYELTVGWVAEAAAMVVIWPIFIWLMWRGYRRRDDARRDDREREAREMIRKAMPSL